MDIGGWMYGWISQNAKNVMPRTELMNKEKKKRKDKMAVKNRKKYIRGKNSARRW